MQVAKLIADRQRNWTELDRLCNELERRRTKKIPAETITRFSFLYRSACADLALAETYQLPSNTVQYLHRLVGRSHNQLYRARSFDYQAWKKILLEDVPQRIFRDGCVQTAFIVFWGIFLASAYLAASGDVWPDYAVDILGQQQIEGMESSFAEPIGRENSSMNSMMAGFYIYNNAGIGLKCFAGGLLVIPGLLITIFNAAYLGAAFGYMARPDVTAGVNFFHFVTAHGPFELTAIVLSAGAGLRLGLSWMMTHGLTRIDSMRETAKEVMPVMGAALILFLLAALIEGFLSPSAAPYVVKAAVAIITSAMLMFYFVVLGYPRKTSRAT